MRAIRPPSFAYCTESYSGNPAASPGTTVTGGLSNADGTAVAIIGTALTHNVQQLNITVSAATLTSAAATDSSQIVDILMDPAGGTSWDTTNILIEGLMCGYMQAQLATSGYVTRRIWRFPLFVPAGATLAARSRSTKASGNTDVQVSIRAYGGPSSPVWYGQKVDAIGINRAASGGTSITPGATLNTYPSFGSFGSATARRYGALLPCVTGLGTNIGTQNFQLQLGIGSVQIGHTFNYATSNAELSSPLVEDNLIYCDVPEATQLQARIRSSASSEPAQQLIIHGVS